MIGKTLLPKSLFGRALLILVLPMVLVQLILAYVFFDRHWDNITRRMSVVLANEVVFLANELEQARPLHMPPSVTAFERATDLTLSLDPAETLRAAASDNEFPELKDQLRAQLAKPFTVRKTSNGSTIEIRVKLAEQVMTVNAPVRRLESRTTVIFVSWMIGASVIFVFIAVLFMRNQIRPIRKLAEAADSFGRGLDTPGFKPSGATEVRTAARAFIVMRERIKRQIRTRTDMLSGISHDLRTPLTRMKLQLAMLDKSDEVRELSDDVQQMEHMIEEYLDFARGEGREEATSASLKALLSDIVSDYTRLSADVALASGEDVVMDLRQSGMRRMLHNIVDNALRHGKRAEISWRISDNFCEIIIDDDGPGIPADKRDEVFKPFSRLDTSRNPKTGGVGLGLTIARDIAQAHGGSIALDTSPLGGLRVIIKLPL